MAYSPAPAVGRVNLPLRNPELYDLVNDPEESYDVAPEHPKVVAEIQARIDRLLAGFPEEIRQARAETLARAAADTAVGAVPRPGQP